MSLNLARTGRLIVIGVALATALGACGRRGALEPPPGMQDQPRVSGQSTFAGSPSFRPPRGTDTTLRDQSVAEGAPPVPIDPMEAIQNPNQTFQGNSSQGAIISGAQTGLTARSDLRNSRRSPPPDRPFILDPLL